MGIQEKTLDPDDPGLAFNLADWATVLLNQVGECLGYS